MHWHLSYSEMPFIYPLTYMLSSLSTLLCIGDKGERRKSSCLQVVGWMMCMQESRGFAVHGAECWDMLSGVVRRKVWRNSLGNLLFKMLPWFQRWLTLLSTTLYLCIIEPESAFVFHFHVELYNLMEFLITLPKVTQQRFESRSTPCTRSKLFLSL